MKAPKARAYVKYVKADGTIQTVPISPDRIKYRVLNYTPLTQGSFEVEAAVDDQDAVAGAEIRGVTPVRETTQKTVAIADKIYMVTLTTGEHASFVGGAVTVQIPTVYGRSVIAPGLDIEYGYKMDQWTDEAGHAIRDINAYPITSDQSIRVTFKLKEYVVNFYGRGGRVLSTQIVKHGYDAVPPTDARDVLDKKFDGWSRSYKHITSDMNIHALYFKQTGPSIGGDGSGVGPGAGTGTGTGTGMGTGTGSGNLPAI